MNKFIKFCICVILGCIAFYFAMMFLIGLLYIVRLWETAVKEREQPLNNPRSGRPLGLIFGQSRKLRCRRHSVSKKLPLLFGSSDNFLVLIIRTDTTLTSVSAFHLVKRSNIARAFRVCVFQRYVCVQLKAAREGYRGETKHKGLSPLPNRAG